MIILFKPVNPLLLSDNDTYSVADPGFPVGGGGGGKGSPTSDTVTFRQKYMAKRNNLLRSRGRGTAT